MIEAAAVDEAATTLRFVPIPSSAADATGCYDLCGLDDLVVTRESYQRVERLRADDLDADDELPWT
jgi:hypothetical protein